MTIRPPIESNGAFNYSVENSNFEWKLSYGHFSPDRRIPLYKEAGSKVAQEPMDEIHAWHQPHFYFSFPAGHCLHPDQDSIFQEIGIPRNSTIFLAAFRDAWPPSESKDLSFT